METKMFIHYVLKSKITKDVTHHNYIGYVDLSTDWINDIQKGLESLDDNSVYTVTVCNFQKMPEE